MTDSSSPVAAIERRLLSSRADPLTVSQMARLLGLPGPTDGARAQLLRRLESRGVLPPSRRSLARGDRYYKPADAEVMRAAVITRNRGTSR